MNDFLSPRVHAYIDRETCQAYRVEIYIQSRESCSKEDDIL